MPDYTAADIARHELEWRKCSKDFAYWVDTYCMMWLKEGGDPIEFKLWTHKADLDVAFQWDFAAKLQRGLKFIVLKARQMGLSWIVSAYTLWKCMFKKNFHAYYTSIGLKEVQEQQNRIRFMFHNLPEWQKERAVLGGKDCKDNDSLIEFTNGSAIHATASGRSAGHGAAAGLFICDEWARVDNAVEKWRAIKPSLGKNSQIVMISTSDGLHNHFADVWFDAKKGENQFLPVFYGAKEHPEYTDEYLLEQLRDFAGDLQGYKQAFPITEDDAWLSSSRSVFDITRIQEWKEYIRTTQDYPEVGIIDPALDKSDPNAVNGRIFTPDQMEHLQIWRRPVHGHRYTMGVDVSKGLIQGDWSVAVVFDTDTREVVALYRAKIAPENYGYPIENIARYYNNAWLCVEVNIMSEVIMQDLKQTYPWLYRRQIRKTITDLPTLEPGFVTSGTSKPRIILQLRREFSDFDNPLRIYSDTVLDEMAVYEQHDGQKLEAAKGYFDDCVMALALALEAETTIPFTMEDWSIAKQHEMAQQGRGRYDYRSL